MKRLKHLFRPRNVHLVGYAFTDAISGLMVFRWHDGQGNQWLAEKARTRPKNRMYVTPNSDPTLPRVVP